jgi:hypothetical protein
MLDTGKLTDVIYTAGKVFDNLRSDRLATQSFISNGDIRGIASRADLELLKDLNDAAKIILECHNNNISLSPSVVISINSAMTRSAALRPGVFRQDSDNIGVSTRFGDHRPAAVGESDLQIFIDEAAVLSTEQAAATLFVSIAKAQPFGDGNKRTALLAANLLLLPSNKVLTVPFKDDDPEVSAKFNELLARAYIYDEVEACVNYMVSEGIMPF